MDLVTVLIAPAIGAIVGSSLTWFFRETDHSGKLEKLKEENKRLSSKSSQDQTDLRALRHFQKKYTDIKNKLERSGIVEEYYQPVLLVGPINVGKTSLLRQWNTPWEYSKVEPTASYKTTIVPIIDLEPKDYIPHFADPDILVPLQVQLKLKVHDFPGELTAQPNIIQKAIEETKTLRKITKKALGVVLICIFDAEEVAEGKISPGTIEYYNGELFAKLRDSIEINQVGIERVILVFNKCDRLKTKFPDKDDEFLLEKCREVFSDAILRLRAICNPERFCGILTILDIEKGIASNVRGAETVKGEAARNFVEAIAGAEVAKKFINEDPNSGSCKQFF